MWLDLLSAAADGLWLLIGTLVFVPVVLLVSLIDFIFLNPFSLIAHNGTERDPTVYDPRWQAIEEVHFNWRCIVLLSLLGTWRNNIFLGLRVSTMTLTIPHGSSVTNVIPPFTCNVQPGSLKEWSEIKDFCAHSSFADNFKSVGVLCIA